MELEANRHIHGDAIGSPDDGSRTGHSDPQQQEDVPRLVQQA
jgi:hypothetical protein